MSTRVLLRGLALSTLLVVTATACGGDEPARDGSAGAERSGPPAPALPQGDDPVDLDPADFTTDIDNPYWPMQPGTRWTYREVDEEGNAVEVVVVVTTETKKIANGVTARVVRDTVTEDGVLIEDTFDWYAQDGDGNVWYLGEDTAEFEAGKITTRAGSFEAGVDGALPGIIMPADPQPGLRLPAGVLRRRGRGQRRGAEHHASWPRCRPACSDDALLTKDTITIEPDVLEYKLYARGVGPVLVLGVSGGGGREELVSVDQAPPSAGTGPLGSPNP